MTESTPKSRDDSAARPEEAVHAMKSSGGVARIGNAMKYSWLGLKHAVRHEAAFRQELVLVLPLLTLVWFLPISVGQRVLLIAVSINVLIVELLNSAVEAAIDRISVETHPLSGRAKDLGSAAVFLAITLMVLSWLMISGPVVLRWLGLAR